MLRSHGRARLRAIALTAIVASSTATAALVGPGGAEASVAPGATPMQSAAPSASPSPSDSPTESPTSTPTPTNSGTPTSSPTGTPTSPPPTSQPPTSRPPTSHPPTGTPTQTQPPSTPPPPTAPIIDQEAAAAFALATAHLRTATDALDAAKARVLDPGMISVAQGHARRADSAVDVATQRIAGVVAALQHQRGQVNAANYAVGGNARQAYVDGPSAELSSVLAADGLADLADRMGTLAIVDKTSGQAVDNLSTARSRLDSLESALTAAQAARARAVDERDGLQGQVVQMAKAAQATRDSLPVLQQAVDAAIAEAKAAIPADQALAAQQGAESDRLASQIVAASKQLEDEGGVVAGTGAFARPATGPITSPYGWRYHPILHYYKMHTGVDFAGDDGVVYAADDGVVILTVWSSAYGNVTVIDHGRSGGQYFASFYAHQAGYFVKVGDTVHKGQPIGAVGATGLATGPHLHFEVRLNGSPVDPMPFLPAE